MAAVTAGNHLDERFRNENVRSCLLLRTGQSRERARSDHAEYRMRVEPRTVGRGRERHLRPGFIWGWKADGDERAVGSASGWVSHAVFMGRVPAGKTHFLPRLPYILKPPPPHPCSRQAHQALLPPKFERFFAFTRLSLLSSALRVFHLEPAMCLLGLVFPPRQSSLILSVILQRKASQGRFLGDASVFNPASRKN